MAGRESGIDVNFITAHYWWYWRWTQCDDETSYRSVHYEPYMCYLLQFVKQSSVSHARICLRNELGSQVYGNHDLSFLVQAYADILNKRSRMLHVKWIKQRSRYFSLLNCLGFSLGCLIRWKTALRSDISWWSFLEAVLCSCKWLCGFTGCFTEPVLERVKLNMLLYFWALWIFLTAVLNVKFVIMALESEQYIESSGIHLIAASKYSCILQIPID